MKDYTLKKDDFVQIFKKSLKYIDFEIKAYEDYMKAHNFTENQIICKLGLCAKIRDTIYEIFEESNWHIKFSRETAREECTDIIYKVTGHKFRQDKLYWNWNDNANISIEEWYKPRIECIRKVLEYLKNLK